MKIYSWNMLFDNRQLDKAFEFVAQSNFDIFCLQEVSEIFLKRLQTLEYHLSYQLDAERLSPQYEKIYLVVLSRHNIIHEEGFTFPDYWERMSAFSHMLIHLMRPLKWTRLENRKGMFVDLAVGDHKDITRIFNLHLTLANPVWRGREFETAMQHRELSMPTIVCGDFNIIEKPHVTILSWLFGGSLGDVLLYRRERRRMEARFATLELTNVMAGKMTHPLSQSQLDHILVSKSLSIKNAEVIKNRMGSDHHPIHVEVA